MPSFSKTFLCVAALAGAVAAAGPARAATCKYQAFDPFGVGVRSDHHGLGGGSEKEDRVQVGEEPLSNQAAQMAEEKPRPGPGAGVCSDVR